MGSYYTKFPLSQCTDYTVSLPHVEDNLGKLEICIFMFVSGIYFHCEDTDLNYSAVALRITINGICAEIKKKNMYLELELKMLTLKY